MSALSINPPYPVFPDIDGQPLEDGYIWIGTAGMNPISNPIVVYWDDALTIPAPQPIRTIGGFPARAGSPARLYANSDYSIQVQNKNGSVTYSAMNATDIVSSDLVTFIQAGAGAVQRTAQSKMRDIVSVKDFGAVSDGATDNFSFFAAAIATGKDVYVPDGSFMVDITSGLSLTLNPGQSIYGNGHSSKILVKNTSTTVATLVEMESDCSVHQLDFDVYNTNESFVDSTDLTDADKDFDFNKYVIFVGNVTNAQNLRIESCRLSHALRSYSLSEADTVNVCNNYIYQIGSYIAFHYICTNVVFSNNICKYGADFGGVAFSSCKKIVVDGNLVVASGTGINFGGSSAVGFNVEEVVVTGNHVTARDCILFENGAEVVQVTGNYCSVLEDLVAVGTDGTGIACTSHSSNVFGGALGNIGITGNNVKNYNSTYATGIYVASTAPSAQDCFGVVITGNNVEGASNGIRVSLVDTTKAINDVVITGNKVIAPYAILAYAVSKFHIADNICKTSSVSVIGNYYGINLDSAAYGTVANNEIIGFGYALSLGNVTEVVIDDCRNLPIPAGIGSYITSNASYPSWFAKGVQAVVDQTSTGTSLLINAATQTYTPASPVTINGLLAGFSPSGETITIYFGNGNTTIQHGNNIFLRGGVTVTPSAGQIITFLKIGSNLYETARNF
jgi:hypothetical protein